MRWISNRRGLVAVVSIVAIVAGAVYAKHRYEYPYGWSHCCSKLLGSALRFYAIEHSGKFPTGGKTPEASLALLFSEYADAYLLRGKTVPLAVTQHALENQKTLTPESCGWHYVDGLTENDDPMIAIAWDKVGLGHNGQRPHRRGGHDVVYVGGLSDFVSGPDWPAFLERQKQLLESRTDMEKSGIPALTAMLKLPDGKIVDHLDESYVLSEKFPTGFSESSGPRLSTNVLRWNRFQERAHPITFILTLPSMHLRSKPITVGIQDGKPATNTVLFEMEKF